MDDYDQYTSGYIFSKTVDLSTLNQGFSIPITIQSKFYKHINRVLKRGDKTEVKIILDNEVYKVKLINQAFDSAKYPTHKDVLQIRFSKRSPISFRLKEIFSESNDYITEKKKFNKLTNNKQFIKIPDKLKETIALYESEYEDTFIAECITLNDYNKNTEANITEEEYEMYNNVFNYEDSTARIVIKSGDYKIRKLNRNISLCLKEFYDYRCQICGQRIGSNFNVNVVESHHIESFSLTQNNSIKNQIIVCPNHHRIIHKAKPIFVPNKAKYIYENGFEQFLMINKHL